MKNENLDIPADESLMEVSTGARGQKAGALKLIELPGDNRIISEFIKELVAVLKDKGLYRRSTVPVLPYDEEKRLELLDASAFVSWIEDHVICFKKRFDEDGSPYNVTRSMPGEVSEKTLASWGFWKKLPNVLRVNVVPKPVRRANGTLALPVETYDEESKTLIFKP